MLPQMLAGPLIFGLSFWALTTPRAAFGVYYLTFLALYWVASAYGYLVSALVPPNLAQLTGVVAVFTHQARAASPGSPGPSLPSSRRQGFLVGDDGRRAASGGAGQHRSRTHRRRRPPSLESRTRVVT
jgi:hypothetical protein